MRDAGPVPTLFASYNIHKCVGVDRKFDPDRIVRVIEEIAPDVIALQEADKRFGDRGALLDLDRLHRETGLVPVPVENGHSGHGWHGNLVLVREGLVRGLHQIRLPGLEPRGALVVDLDLAAGPVRVVAAHLGLLRQSRLLQIETLLNHARAATDRPVVFMGDLNEWRLQGRSSLVHTQTVFGPLGRGVPSFPAYYPVLALDRVFVTPAGLVDEFVAHVSPLARLASDHLPVKARVRLAGAAAGVMTSGATDATHARPERRHAARLRDQERPSP